MPTYSFRDNKTGREFNDSMSISQLEIFLNENAHIEQIITVAPALADPSRLSIRKPDSGFRDVLKRIKKASGRKNSINTW